MPPRQPEAALTPDDRRRPRPQSGPPSSSPWTRLAVLVVMLVGISVVRFVVNNAGLAISVYALLPIVLAAFWFELGGALAVAVAASVLFVVDELVQPFPDLVGSQLWVAAGNRGLVFLGVAVLVVYLLRRERGLRYRVAEQQDQLDELQALRSALTPSRVPPRPHLVVATSFTPAAGGLVAGDFFLVAEGPMGSTTIVVGDVVGHGLEAARCAAYVRATLATFARFSRDPAQLLQLANAALAERLDDRARFVTVACLNIGAPPTMRVDWACAGHNVPWLLDTGAQLEGGRVGEPLGIAAEELKVEAGSTWLAPGVGLLLFTDGLTEGRAAHRDRSQPLELFGEERARQIIRAQRGADPAEVVGALVAAVTTFAGGPLADDICLVAVRTTCEPPPPAAWSPALPGGPVGAPGNTPV